MERTRQRLNNDCKTRVNERVLGGAKKRTLAQTEKQQTSEQAKEEKRGKAKSSSMETSIKNMTVPKLEESEAAKIFGPMKAITTYSTAKALGINASLAWGVIKNLESKGTLKKEGGHSGHYVYSFASKKKPQK
jgi:small subunit ribosomal protein S25e